MSFRGYKQTVASNASGSGGYVDYNAEIDRKRQALMDDFKTESFRQPDSEQARYEEQKEEPGSFRGSINEQQPQTRQQSHQEYGEEVPLEEEGEELTP